MVLDWHLPGCLTEEHRKKGGAVVIEGEIGESAWRSVDRVLIEYNRRIAELEAQQLARVREDAVRDKRIDKLVERLDRAYTKIHAIERKLRAQETP